MNKLSAEAIRYAVRDLRYPLPRLRPSFVQTREPTVLFCEPDYDRPSGGIRVAYRHVDILNRAGIPAAILHRRPGFRCSWFQNSTRVLNTRDCSVEPNDLVVVGELATELLDDLPGGFRFVIFNQNVHLTWKRATAEAVARWMGSPSLAAVVTVSDHGLETLRYAFPQAPIFRVHNAVDPEIFHPGGDFFRGRERVLAYMPRRGREEAQQVLGLLHARGLLDGWQVRKIDGVSEFEVGNRLREATIFLSTSQKEGFGMPAVEAMACGTYVVGYDGFAGREFFRPAFSSAVATGDVLEFARVLESVIATEEREPGWCEGRAARAASFVQENYSPRKEREDVTNIYRELLEERSA